MRYLTGLGLIATMALSAGTAFGQMAPASPDAAPGTTAPTDAPTVSPDAGPIAPTPRTDAWSNPDTTKAPTEAEKHDKDKKKARTPASGDMAPPPQR